MKNMKHILFIIVLVFSVLLCQQIIELSVVNQDRKQDYAEISNIKYGLFSINQWKTQLSDIISDEISDLDLKGNEKKLRPLIEAQLNELIDGVNKKIQEKNKETFKGKLKQAFINTFVDIKDIKEGIPQYATEIMKLMEKPKSKRKLRSLLIDKVEEYFYKTFENQDYSPITAIIQKTGSKDMAEARLKLEQDIEKAQRHIFILTWTLISFSVLLFLIAGLSKEVLPSNQYIILVLMLFLLLLSGVTTPMIDLEAKISEMSFVLMDHPVQFLNQILYFQTKSVLDVFWIMITHSDIQMKIVGILMVAFSVVFPILKLTSSVGYYYNYARDSQWVQFFVLKSGKWSMTDVMIIAIFMAYIGFNGIISSQFGKLHSAGEEIVLLTTNGTSLQPGFYLFLAYALLALFLSEFLTQKINKELSPTKQNL